MEGVDVLDGEEGIFDLSSGDEESVVITKEAGRWQLHCASESAAVPLQQRAGKPQ